MSPCLAMSTMSGERLVRDLKNIVMILCRSCASCSCASARRRTLELAGCAIGAHQANARHAQRVDVVRESADGCSLRALSGGGGWLGSSFSATTRASWSKPTVCALTLMIGAGLAERQKLTMCTTWV